jgi:hypothetical protein
MHCNLEEKKMTSTTAIPTVAPSVTSTQAAVAPAATVNTGAQATSSVTQAAQTTAASISPRIIDDPTAGVITQYLNSSGKVALQFPSTTVVAYLRAGLTAEGLSRHTANTGHATTTVA